MAKDEKSGSKRSRRERTRDKPKPPTKIVIRHLPPTMSEEEFLKQIDPLPEHDFYYFAEADWSLGFDATCRAYITLKNYDDVFLFRDRFDGYVFVDSKGAEYAAIVEFAPFQGFLKNKSRNSDNKVNTIEQESHYQQFLKKLEEDREAAAKGGESKLEFSLDSKKEEITSTPLLQYLATKREKRRDDAKKRSAEKKRRREEEREKRKQNQASTQQVKVLTNSDNKSARAEKAERKHSPAKDEPKNARARRREQRNRLRHEAYLQKKQAGYNNAAAEKDSSNHNKKEESDKITDSPSEENPPEANQPVEILKKSKADELTESVRNFILTAATNIPAATEEAAEITKNKTNVEDNTEDKTKSTEDLVNVQEKLAKVDINKEDQTIREEQKPLKEPKDTSKRDKITQKQLDDKREERRIRNKDRPSIAIYQPKARLRLSEESDSNSASKDIVGSKSASDCEAVKKDEQPRLKKVQRYSERSKNRKANKEPPQEEEPKPEDDINSESYL